MLSTSPSTPARNRWEKWVIDMSSCCLFCLMMVRWIEPFLFANPIVPMTLAAVVVLYGLWIIGRGIAMGVQAD